MAAILKLRRGTTASPSLVDGELFLNYTTGTIQFASSSVVSNILPLDKSITGTIILDGDISGSNLYLTGDITARDINARNVVLSGDIFLGDGNQSTDNIYVNASFSGSLLPDTTNVYNLGNENFRYKELHVSSAFADTATINDITLPSSRILSSSLGDYQDFDTFSGSVDTRFEILNSYTQSTDQRLGSIETFTQSVDLRVTDLEVTGSDHESRLDVIETTFSSSVDSRLDLLENFSSSEYQIDSSSFDTRLNDSEFTGSNQELRIDNLELSQSFFDNIFSSSVDDRLDSLEIFSESLDAEFLNTNGDNVVSSSVQIDIEQTTNYTTFSSSLQLTDSGLDSRILDLETTFSSSVDLRLDNLELTGSDHETRLDTIETTFSSSIDSRFEILNSYTQSNDLRVIDLETTGSDHESRLDVIETTFSSSVDSRINGLNLYTSSLKNAIAVDGSNLTVIGDLLVQGTTTTLNTTDLIVEDKLLAIASGSTTSAQSDGAGFFISGANASFIWNHSNQLLEFNTKVSSSVGFKGDGSELTNVLAANVEFNDILNKPTLVSGSSQISFNGIVDKPTLVSGSSQIDLTQTTNYVSGIKDRLNAENIFSSSVQVNADTITNFDTNVRDIFITDVVHTGSFLGTATTSDLDEGSNLYYTQDRVKTKLNIEGVISGSTQILNGSGILSSSNEDFVTFSGSVDTRLDSLEQTSSSLDTIFLKVNGDGVVSGSNGDQLTSSFDSRYVNESDYSFDSSSFDLRLDTIETTFSSSVDSRLDSLELDQHTHSNKSNLDTIDQNLSSTDSVTFDSLTISSLPLEPTSSLLLQGVLYSSSGELVYSDFGDIIYYNVSSSIANPDPDAIGTAQAVKTYIDDQLIIIGAGDITAVLAGDGMSGGAFSGSATLTLDTASLHFTNGVVSSLPIGIISGSTFNDLSSSVDLRLDSLELFSSSLDADYVTQAELAAATSSLENSIATKLNTGSFNSFTQSYNLDSQSFDSRLDILELTSESLDLTYLQINGDSVVSGSSQVDITQTTNYTSFSSSLDGRLVNQELFSESIDTTIKTKMNLDGVISGSSQVLAGSGIVSSSQQISDYNTFLEINGMGVVSGSSQVDVNQTQNFSSFSQSIEQDLTEIHAYTSSLKTAISVSGTDVTVIGNLDVQGITTTIDSTTVQIGDNIIELNGTGATNGGLLVKDVTAPNTNSGSLLWDSTNDYWKAGTLGAESRILLAGGDGIISGSTFSSPSQGTLSAVINGNTQSVDLGLQTTDTVQFAKLGVGGASDATYELKVTGDIGATGDVVAYISSDRRLKDEITPIENSLQKINSIGGYSFVWNENQHIYKGKDYGVIAQEIENILPELVETRENGYKAVKYDRIVSLLIEGIKELSKEVSELKEKIGK